MMHVSEFVMMSQSQLVGSVFIERFVCTCCITRKAEHSVTL